MTSNVETPAASETICGAVPSPHVTRTEWVSAAPGSANEPCRVATAPSSTSSMSSDSPLGATLLTVTDAVSVWPMDVTRTSFVSELVAVGSSSM